MTADATQAPIGAGSQAAGRRVARGGLPRFGGSVIGGLVGGALLVAVLADHHRTQVPAGLTPVRARNLLFSDAAGGDVRVSDADSGALVAMVQGQAGFLRGTLRGLASARRLAGKSAAVPFRLASWPDGRLTLDDPATGRHVELEAFGATNEAAFAGFLAR